MWLSETCTNRSELFAAAVAPAAVDRGSGSRESAMWLITSPLATVSTTAPPNHPAWRRSWRRDMPCSVAAVGIAGRRAVVTVVVAGHRVTSTVAVMNGWMVQRSVGAGLGERVAVGRVGVGPPNATRGPIPRW